MTSPERQTPARPAPSQPRAKDRPVPPAHDKDSVLDSLGKAITDPMREAAGEVTDADRQARRDAKPDPWRDDDD